MSATDVDVEVVEDGESPITAEDAQDDGAQPGTLEHAEGEPVTDPEGRCEAQTEAGGNLYQCALQEGHEGDHAFQQIDDDPPPRPNSAEDGRKIQDALEGEAVRHAARLAEIFGADIPPAKGRTADPARLRLIMDYLEGQGLIACDLCPPNFGGWRAEAAPNEETVNRVRVVIGLPDVSNFAPSATERQCDDCRGLGKVRTGSTVTNKETIRCDACDGNGWVKTRERMHSVDAAPTAPGETDNVVAIHDDGIRRDMFGTPEGDPDFEKMPNARQRPVDYWQTHRA